jgi:hypothetical protein
MLAVMESIDRDPSLHEGMRWVPVEAIGGAAAAVEPSIRGMPWSRMGWRDDALAWVDARLDDAGVKRVAPSEQVRHWSISSIWRIPTAGGGAWFKAVPPMFAYEGTLLRLIAPSMPAHLPKLVATDRTRGWTLMEAIASSTPRDHDLWQSATADERDEEALRVLAELQQSWIGREEDLFGAGCSDRRLHTLQSAIDELLSSETVAGGLTHEERARLAALRAEIPRRVDELRACGIPETLVHGDFHAGNVASEGERVIIFDWTDGCVSHPFFDMATFLPRDPVDRAALLHVYLDAWKVLGDPDRIDRAWEIAEPLACIHHALSYKRILDAVDPALRWEFDTDVAFWLRWLRDIV